ncbi:Rrf2 family cysteine metabolism transcriptional repressor [Alkalibacillus filiformis]|uniref:Rrf2 family cysteine metabolism transcriptional repressor n=1 Tax=Alkalibacillus filiformis TaxID=200990 RepID=A0ABU0DRQ8_9BACI|nr:Rrf2 family transcriptional regulator [Alkalibacillus filiformis]MDQ0351120.1 Rrf2 family cysteine metabolism transcriptional repressor [Alkalibacillus filiformis]
MKISTKGRYGLTIMIALAKNYGDKPIPLKSIASEYDLSEHYLEQLIAPLRNEGLVKSVRGAKGGYLLTREPKLITAADIIKTLEGPIRPVEEMDDEEPSKRELWKRIRDAVKDVLETTSLQDLVDYDDNNYQEEHMFYI